MVGVYIQCYVMLPNRLATIQLSRSAERNNEMSQSKQSSFTYKRLKNYTARINIHKIVMKK